MKPSIYVVSLVTQTVLQATQENLEKIIKFLQSDGKRRFIATNQPLNGVKEHPQDAVLHQMEFSMTPNNLNQILVSPE